MIKILMATYHRAHLLQKTLESLKEAFTNHPEGVRLYAYDNASGEDVAQQLLAFQQLFPGIVRLTFGDRNIGKAKALNSFIPQIEDADVVCSFDSDLIIERSIMPDRGSFFICGEDLMRNGFQTGPTTGRLSVIVPDQTGNGQHLVNKIWWCAQGDPREERMESDFGFNVAGSCLFTMGSTYKAVKGYQENRGIFGGNDGYFLQDASRHEKKPVAIVKNLVVWHQPDDDEGYADWKRTAQDQQRTHQRCLSNNGFYD